jgi:hypothetical protein
MIAAGRAFPGPFAFLLPEAEESRLIVGKLSGEAGRSAGAPGGRGG